jgi:hypothetical protein
MQNAYHFNHKTAKTVLHLTVVTRDKDVVVQEEVFMPM